MGDIITIKDVPSEQESIQFHVCKISSETGQRETWGEIAEQHGMGAKELYDLNADNPMHKDGALALDNELRVKNTAQSEAPDVVYRNALSPEDVSGDKWVFSFANVWSVIEKPFSDVAHTFVQDDTALNKNTSVIKVNSIRLHSKILSGSDGLEAIAQEKKGAIKKGDKDTPKNNEIKTIQEALLGLNFDLGKYGADGDFGSGTEQAVIDFQREFVPTHEVHTEYEIRNHDGVVGKSTLLALDEAVAIEWIYKIGGMNEKWLIVPKGQLTFDAEGNDIDSSIYFSRKSHIPNNNGIVIGNSGVTLGRGLDIGSPPSGASGQFPSKLNLQTMFDGAELNPKLSKWLLSIEGKTKKDGFNALKETTLTDAELTITRKQQYLMFNYIYDYMEEKTKILMTKPDIKKAYGDVKWGSIPEKVKEVLVDLTYRGDNQPTSRKKIVPALVKDALDGNDSYDNFKTAMEVTSSSWVSVPLDRKQKRFQHL